MSDRRTMRTLFAALAVAVAAVPLTLNPTAPAVAEDAPAQVLIESVVPGAPQPKQTLRVSGRVANTGDAEIALPRMELRLSPLPLNSRGEINEVLDGSTERTGNALPATAVDLGASLVPGQQRNFTLSVPMSELGLDPAAAGVYAVFAELMSGELTIAQQGTTVPWFPPDAEYEASRLAWVWPITQRPALAADDLVIDPALPDEFAAGGRLSRLLDAGSRLRVSWLIDTATVDTARVLADGYQVPGPDGPEPGEQTDAAGQFADRLTGILSSQPTTITQYAWADDDALQRAGLDQFVVRSASLPSVTVDDEARGAPTQLAFAAPGGNSDESTLQALVDAGVRELLLSDQYYPPDPPTSFTPSGVTDVSVNGTETTGLLSDRLLSRSLARPLDTAADRSRARQAFLADTALLTLELPTESRSVIADAPLLWDPPERWLAGLARAVADAPWIRLVPLETVADATQTPRLALGYSDANRRRELPPDYTRRIGELDRELDQLTRIVVDPTGYGESFRLALQRSGSALWRDDEAGRTTFLDTIATQLQEQKDKVRVVSSGTVTLAGDSGVVPLTIANDLDRPVTVGVQLATDNPITLQYTPPEPIRIEAKEKSGVEVPVRVVGSQTMTVSIVLTDSEGELYDDSASIELRSTAASRVATIVVGVGAVALVILVSLNLMRRRRNRTDEPTPDLPLDHNV